MKYEHSKTHQQNTLDREHCGVIQNNTDDAVPPHFNQSGHQLTDIELIPLELINTKKGSIRRAEKIDVKQGTKYC